MNLDLDEKKLVISLFGVGLSSYFNLKINRNIQLLLSAGDENAIRSYLNKIIREVSSEKLSKADSEVKLALDKGISIITIFSPIYPEYLREIPDPPLVLFLKTREAPQELLRKVSPNHASVGIVGARRCTEYGFKQSAHFARCLSEKGVTVISGLARGIDGAAHGAVVRSLIRAGRGW